MCDKKNIGHILITEKILKIDNIALHLFFTEKEITHLHHANTLATSVTFIQNGGLLSRGYVEKNGLYQTFQSSDSDDKLFDVWDDIFLDTADLHAYFKRQNKYGPILFKFNIDFLLNESLDIWITKDNPIYWQSIISVNDRYFQTIDEVRLKWDEIENQKKMITIRKPYKPVLFDYLEEIVVDNPKVNYKEEIACSTEMITALDVVTQNNQQLRNKAKQRECSSCYCYQNYSNEVTDDELAKLFLPRRYHPKLK